MSERRKPPWPYLPVPPATWQPVGRELSLAERAVLAVVLERWSDGVDVVSVGVPLIGRCTGLGETAAKRALASLLAAGLLVRVHTGNGRGRVSSYRLGDPVFAGKGVANGPLSGVGKGSRKGVADRPKRGRETTPVIRADPDERAAAATAAPLGASVRTAADVLLRMAVGDSYD